MWVVTDTDQKASNRNCARVIRYTPYEFYDEWAVRNMTIDVPGAARPNIKALGHKIVRRPIYPLDEDMSYTPHVEVFD